MNQNERIAEEIKEAAYQLGALRRLAEVMIENESWLDVNAFANLVISTTIGATVRLDACALALSPGQGDSGELVRLRRVGEGSEGEPE